jgi:hypothetical protein
VGKELTAREKGLRGRQVTVWVHLLDVPHLPLLPFVSFFDTESRCVAQAGLELGLWPAGIIALHHRAWPPFAILVSNFVVKEMILYE